MKTYCKTTVIGSQLEIGAETLDLINASNAQVNYTTQDVDKLFTAEAVLTSDEPNLNGDVYSAEMQSRMKDAWIGTPVVYSETDHRPDAPDHSGWIYQADVRQRKDGITETVAQMVIPIIEDNARIVERLRNGLNKPVSTGVRVTAARCSECSEPIDLSVGRCGKHPRAHRVLMDGAPIHLAFVGDGANPSAKVLRTSASVEDDPQEDRLTIDERVQLDEYRAMRNAPLATAIKFARLNDPTLALEDTKQRLEKFTLRELEWFIDTQKARYEATHISGQLAKTPAEGDEQRETEWKPISELIGKGK